MTDPEDYVFELYTDNAGEWRWHLVAPNNEIIADSSEGYESKGGARNGLDRVREVAAGASVEVVDGDAVSPRERHN